MDRFEAMSVIIAVSETGSFSAASRKLKSPVATVSRKVSELEARLKTQLFQRSSRRVALTDAGRSYMEACKRIIEQVNDAERKVTGEYLAPKGDLAVTAPWGLGHMHLLPIAIEFLSVYPDVALRLVLTDRIVNTVDEDIDVAIRIGDLADNSRMISTRVGAVRVVVCGSPAYFAAHGPPKEPADLRDHDCITVDEGASRAAWRFMEGNRVIVAPIRSRLTVNTSEAAVEAAVTGCGLARVMSYKMEAARQAGKLSVVLESFEQETLPVHIVYPQRKLVPVKLRFFLDWVTPRLKTRLA
jgi:DNA-binding transcriptional LysR family regulator